MARTQEQEREDMAAYAAAFDDDMAPKAEPSEDEAFGLTPPVEDGASEGTATAEGEPPAVVIGVVDGEQVEQAEGQAVADATTQTAGEDDQGGAEVVDPKEEQRRRSWEGRLRAREEELARREAELKSKSTSPDAGSAAEGIEKAAEQLEADGDTEGAQAVDQVAEQVENGDLTAEQAMKILAEDFGPEFVKMIEVIAASKAESAGRSIAEKATGDLSRSVQEIIETIVDDRARAHFEAIAGKHPDFNELAQTPEFAEFTKSYPGGEQIASAGSAKEIIKMLDDFKGAQKPAEQDPAVDAAEGVRSSGMRLPEAPSKASGYEDAWDQF